MSMSAVTTATAKPAAMPVLSENIPTDLREYPQWVVWNWTWNPKGQKWDKPPRSAHTGHKCSKNDPQAWCPFDAALAAYQQQGFDGIGFCFTKDDPFSGIDLDRCRDPDTGLIADWACWIIETLDTYTETSPSGCGVKMFLRGKLGRNHGHVEGQNVEIYSFGAYFTVTGQLVRLA